MKYAIIVTLLFAGIWGAASAGFTARFQAVNMEATIYDDGKSCPGNCDAHVVFAPRHNGTRNAFAPSSSREAPAKCVAGEQCRICFAEDPASCMLATYRGAGPPTGRFDFTPAFFEANCPRSGLPAPFASQCRNAQPALNRLQRQINCIANPTHQRCRTLISTLTQRKAADKTLYDECKRLGEPAFNRKYARQPRLQRSNDCAYEQQRNGGGGRWRRLLDGACRTGHYVGRDGLDCCSGNLYAAALLGRECRGFFLQP
jgi:hypothetical protein